MSWIDVEDRLPDSSRNVLIIKKKLVEILSVDFYHGNEWYKATEGGYEVLRWMEAPRFTDEEVEQLVK